MTLSKQTRAQALMCTSRSLEREKERPGTRLDAGENRARSTALGIESSTSFLCKKPHQGTSFGREFNFHGCACQVGGVFQTCFLSTSVRNKSLKKKKKNKYKKYDTNGVLNCKKTSNTRHLNDKFSIFIEKTRRYNFINLISTLAITHRRTTNKRDSLANRKSPLYIFTYFKENIQVRYKETKSQSLRNCIHSLSVLQVHSVLNRTTDFV